jgi:hypothetical protein
MVNEAVRMTLVEDADDLRDADQWQAEPSSSFEEFLQTSEMVAEYKISIGSSDAKELRAV